MGFWNNELEKIVGLKVLGLKDPFNTGDDTITFITNKGNLELWCDADCCSHSWFEHIELPEFPFTIKKAEEVSGEDVLQEVEAQYECLRTYGFKMETDKGHVDIAMRNSSNGYYGGSFHLDLSKLNE